MAVSNLILRGTEKMAKRLSNFTSDSVVMRCGAETNPRPLPIAAAEKLKSGEIFLSRLLKSGLAVVGLECFRDGYVAFGVLALLEESDEKTGKGGAGSVEGVAEGVFALGILKAELHAAGLVVAKAGTA